MTPQGQFCLIWAEDFIDTPKCEPNFPRQQVESYSLDNLGVVMKVSIIFDDPTVQIAGNCDALELYLVAHFLGMATHDNNNGPPVIRTVPVRPTPEPRVRNKSLAFLDDHRAVKLAEDQEADFQKAYLRAVNEALRPMRLPNEPKSPVSLLIVTEN